MTATKLQRAGSDPQATAWLAGAVRDVLRDRWSDGELEIDRLRRLSGGTSRHTWSLTARTHDGAQRDLILRLDRPGGLEATAIGREAALMVEAGAAGVPSPQILAVDTDGADLGAAFVVMSRVDGETIPQRILRDPGLASARAQMADQCGRQLARIHRMRPAEVPGLEAPDPVDQWRGRLDELGQERPAFEIALRWLETHRPAALPQGIVHGDFRHGNLIVGPEGIVAVLDWELAHLGDPVEDLGWLCLAPWRFGAAPIVGGFGAVEDLLAAYHEESGVRIDRATLFWWMVLGTVKWGAICVHQAERHRSGASASLELALVGRRVVEAEWDVLALMESGPEHLI